MPTIRDVARRAGVGVATVSRVLNNSGYVSSGTRARVLQAVEELGYVPNRLARGLRSKRTQTLGLVLTDITNPFWTTVARGVEDAASAKGFSVILCNTDESPEKEIAYVGLLLQKQIDGFLLVPARNTTESVEMVLARHVPLVVLDRRIPMTVDTVRCDSEGGAYALTRHLLDLGHRRIAVLGGPAQVSTAADRVEGYRRALDEAGVPFDPRLVAYSAFTQESGEAMACQMLESQPRPTALFAVNNFIAIGALRALRRMGLAVPKECSLVGFDDLPSALVPDPFLTVASQPAYDMGVLAGQRLIGRLEGTITGPQSDMVLPTKLIVRRSSGPAPGQEKDDGV